MPESHSVPPANLLFILSDQHNLRGTGCYGGDGITPNLDRLAAAGTRFAAAYTNCPLCVPARASLATGRYVHEIGYWDNAHAYDGRVPSWGHHLARHGLTCDSIGKLHFRGGDDNGFAREIEPLHVVDGEGDLLGCLREDPPVRNARAGVLAAGAGDSTYLAYDVRNADNAIDWLRAHSGDRRPWVLFVGFVCPHPPYVGPPRHFERYDPGAVRPMPQEERADWPDHPAVTGVREVLNLSEPLSAEQLSIYRRAYLAACTHLDEQIGRVLAALDDCRLRDRTRVVYTSDHGESMGARGLTGKLTMYDESAAVPLIMAGPDVPAGRTVATPVSLVDCFPTVLNATGCPLADEWLPEETLPGEDLLTLAAAGDRDRTVFAEHHAVGFRRAVYLLRDSRYKYVHYVGMRPQLFDLAADPDEVQDLAARPEHAETVRGFERRLRAIVDPEEADARAHADQLRKVADAGGREAVIARGTFANSPTPDEAPKWERPAAG